MEWNIQIRYNAMEKLRAHIDVKRHFLWHRGGTEDPPNKGIDMWVSCQFFVCPDKKSVAPGHIGQNVGRGGTRNLASLCRVERSISVY